MLNENHSNDKLRIKTPTSTMYTAFSHHQWSYLYVVDCLLPIQVPREVSRIIWHEYCVYYTSIIEVVEVGGHLVMGDDHYFNTVVEGQVTLY